MGACCLSRRDASYGRKKRQHEFRPALDHMHTSPPPTLKSVTESPGGWSCFLAHLFLVMKCSALGASLVGENK
jgi:hypothetical protein